MPEPAAPLYLERGASWLWLLSGPAAALTMVYIQHRAGVGFQPLVPAMFLVIVTLFMGLQVKAARVHTSVALTAEELRAGTETLALADIVAVYPEPPVRPKAREPQHRWQSARALGELSGVPRGRTAIGLRLVGGRTAQAWARDDDKLRALLIELVDARNVP